MASVFKLPDLGEGIHEGEIIAVLVKPGDAVTEGDTILEVETDKATVEIPSPFTGKVTTVMVKPGDIVNVGDVMIEVDGEEAAKSTPAAAPQAKTEEMASPAPATENRPGVPTAPGQKNNGPVPASPATRRLARELEIDLSRVSPTGPAGLVTAADVRAFSDNKTTAPPAESPTGVAEPTAPGRPLVIDVPPLPDFSKWGQVTRQPLRSIRRATAKQMAVSWAQIPHVNSQDTMDVTRLEELRQRHKVGIEAMGGKLSLTVFAIKAAATALSTYPNFNTTLDIDAGEIIYKDYCHIGVAVNTPHGLVVPVIRDVDKKSIGALAVELSEMVDRARDKKTGVDELKGGCFTITNAGAVGGGLFSPIINYPEVAILGMGQARWQPVVKSVDGKHEIVPRFMMPLVLTIDHRMLDGADAIGFLNFMGRTLSDPEAFLLSMV
ncbi:MAG: biotin/lipoyl-binding protein [Desulfobacteraceae bacterium]|nr:biotin/lipoyl-binding protein [Desulfobacteraceae bacterium]